MEEQLELEFQKLNLTDGDVLIIKTNLQGLSEKEVVTKLTELREDDFVKYIVGKGNRVVVSYSGIDFQILRTLPNDKVLVYVDTSAMNEEESSEYLDIVKNKLTETISNEVVIIPLSNSSIKLNVEQGENNE